MILIGYATKHGSTKEVADAMASYLSERRVESEVRPLAQVKDLSAYSLVVIGAPLYSGKWHKDAHRFLKRHRSILEGLPVAVFALGPRRPRSEGSWPRSEEQLARALAKHPWLKPVSVQVFGGVDPPKKNREQRDQRDWTAIRAWTIGLRPDRGPATPSRP